MAGRSWRCESAVVGLSMIDEAGESDISCASLNGPSSGFPGLDGLDPGIVSRVLPLVGMLGAIASRNEVSTFDVSQVSKLSCSRLVATERVSESTLESLEKEEQREVGSRRF